MTPSMINAIKKCFDLQGYQLNDCRVEEKRIILCVTPEQKTSLCPQCNCKMSPSVHQYQISQIKHGYCFGKIVYLEIIKRRLFCPVCQKPKTEQVPGIDYRSRHSMSCKKQWLVDLKWMSVQAVAEKYSLSHETLNKELKVQINPHQINWLSNAKKIHLGIDGHSFSGVKHFCQSICEVRQKKLLTVLKKDSKRLTKRFLGNLPLETKERIVEAVIDMEQKNKQAIRESLGKKVIITIDHFHVIQMANKIVEDHRLLIQKINKKRIKYGQKVFGTALENLSLEHKELLKEYLKEYPDLAQTWSAKEMLRGMYQCELTRREAQEHLDNLIKQFEEMNDFTRKLAKTLNNWKEEILNYFIYHSTNAFTEGCHTKMKMVKRTGFGYRNIENYIRKVVLAFLPLISILNLYHT